MINSPQYIPNQQYQPHVCPHLCPYPHAQMMPQMRPPMNNEQSSLSTVARYAQPRYSGVSIEIIEPQVKAPNANQMSNAPVYNYPTSSLYAPQGQTNPYAGPMFAYPQTTAFVPQPVNYLPPVQPQIPQSVIPQVPTVDVPKPVVETTPEVIQQPVIIYDVQPVETQQTESVGEKDAQKTTEPVSPTVVEETPITETKATQNTETVAGTGTTTQTTATPDTEAATSTKTTAPTELVIPQFNKPAELATVISGLRSENIDTQAQTMEDISRVLEETPEQGLEYLDPNVVNALVDILDKNTSKLEGPTPRQQVLRQKMFDKQVLTEEETAEAKHLSPMENAEKNKQYALYTIAMVQNALINEAAKKGESIPPNNLPAFENVVRTAKENPNPMLRASAIAGLAHVAQPEYHDIYSTLFTIAKEDEENTVKTIAQDALNRINEQAKAVESAKAQEAPAPQQQTTISA